MAAKVVQLEEGVRVTATTAQQSFRDAADVGAAGKVVVQVNRLAAGAAGALLTLEHAAILEENHFEALSSQTIALDGLGPISVVISSHSRFLRWTLTQAAGSVSAFTIQLVLRDN